MSPIAGCDDDGNPAGDVDAGGDGDDSGDDGNDDGPSDPGGPDGGGGDDGGEDDGGEDDGGGDLVCLEQTDPCEDTAECCGDLTCDTTTLGQVCCGEVGITCATDNGEDCCGDLLCIAGVCSEPFRCEGPCTEPPALVIEKRRLAEIGGSFLGICGDANHTYGFHVPAARLPSSDYSLRGEANQPVCQFHAAAIDIGMDWPASRAWLRWLIEEIRTDRIQGIAEVIGSYDGVNVRYWSDSSGWETDGQPYEGSGHDSWTHVSVYRSTALQDHRILDGWTADGMP